MLYILSHFASENGLVIILKYISEWDHGKNAKMNCMKKIPRGFFLQGKNRLGRICITRSDRKVPVKAHIWQIGK